MLKLIVNNEAGVVRNIKINALPFIIGRSPECNLVLFADGISRQHAKVTGHNGEIFITDLESTNGLFVNGKQVTQLFKLHHNDTITFGGGSAVKIVLENDQHFKTKNALFKFSLSRVRILILSIVISAIIFIMIFHDDQQRVYLSSHNLKEQQEPDKPLIKIDPLSALEVQSRNAIMRLGNNVSYVIPQQQIVENINRKIDRLSDDLHFAAVLQSYQSKLDEINESSGKYNLSPYLICYVDITDRIHQKNDSFFLMKWQDKLQVLISLILPLKQIRGNSADSALSSVIGYRLCYGCPAEDNPLFEILGKSKNSQATVWDMYEQKLIDQDLYDYITTMIAIGVLSYEPKKFGLESLPIVFEQYDASRS